MAGGTASLLLTDSVFSLSPAIIIVQAAAFMFMVWARITFGFRSFHATANPTEGRLITTGPYALIRHPIYTAVCIVVIAGGIVHFSLITCIFVLAVLIGSITRMILEERFLQKRYPEYASYAKRTKRMVPYVF